LTFSLKIGEDVERVDSSKTAIGDSSWQPTADPVQWPSFGYYPATPWNYGLVLDDAQPEKSFTVKKLPWPTDDDPFTPGSAPIQVIATGKQIPEWTLDKYGLCAVLQPGPARSDQPEKELTLIPMGAARLRISAFPTIGSNGLAHQWIVSPIPAKPLYKASASHVFSGDTVDALDDGLAPTASNDDSIPRFTWWDHRGTTEWVQYEFPQSKVISSVEVYWFDDTGKGECRIPKTWRLLYQDAGEWKPVPGTAVAGATRDQFNSMSFPSLRTRELRIEADLQPGFSGGILEWRVQ
jgi:hypothetical protein